MSYYCKPVQFKPDWHAWVNGVDSNDDLVVWSYYTGASDAPGGVVGFVGGGVAAVVFIIILVVVIVVLVAAVCVKKRKANVDGMIIS